jgi:hypothetical protein
MLDATQGTLCHVWISHGESDPAQLSLNTCQLYGHRRLSTRRHAAGQGRAMALPITVATVAGAAPQKFILYFKTRLESPLDDDVSESWLGLLGPHD